MNLRDIALAGGAMNALPHFSELRLSQLQPGRLCFAELTQLHGRSTRHLALGGRLASGRHDRLLFVIDQPVQHNYLQVVQEEDVLGDVLALDDDWTVKLGVNPQAWHIRKEPAAGAALVLLSHEGEAGYYLQGMHCDGNGYSSTMLIRLKDGACFAEIELPSSKTYCSDWEIYLNLPEFGLQRLYRSYAS